MRKSNCNIRGRIGLIQSGSGTVVGAADVVDSLGPLSYEELAANVDKHQSTPDSLIALGYVYAWVLKDARKFAEPVLYNHPRGAIKWVNLSRSGIL
jgi:hypothetical protein